MSFFDCGEVNEYELRAWVLDRVSGDLIAQDRVKEAQILFDWVMNASKTDKSGGWYGKGR